ncbi:hypothetical protein [Maribacter sp. 2304DJ31-5]|uniref:hypothetical protein n=1 Tax=Maribacter sp. 2304DJ31-5 TaxID=3386273 RepID=UPI0039BCCCE3
MRYLIFLFSCSFLLPIGTTSISAQKYKALDGTIKNLKGITSYNLVFDYSDLEIPKYDSEEDFLVDKMQKREEKEAGLGEKFKKSWFSDREEFYEPKFITSFNKRFDGTIKVGKDLNGAEYTILIHTNLIYAGYNVGVWRQNAKIDATITVYGTTDPNTIIYSGKYIDVPGSGAMGYDYNSGYRISEAYAKLAKSFATLIRKKAK